MEDNLQLITSPKIQAFIREHENDDEKVIVLKNKAIHGLSPAIVAEQISGRRKAKAKLPLFYENKIVYPPSVNLEQSSSEQTASFKANLIREIAPATTTLVDLTGGYGVDTFFFSREFQSITCVEPNSELIAIAQWNHRELGAKNVVYENATAQKFLDKDDLRDFFFIDPSRRNENKKVFTLRDSEPNIVEIQQRIFDLSDHLLVKASPLLDIKKGIRELRSVERVVVLAVSNEVRELLFHCQKDFAGEAKIVAHNLGHNASHREFSFNFSEEETADIEFSEPQKYLYEPNAAILKAGAFKLIGKQFHTFKLHPSTHLYTSQSLHLNFPGRIFEIEGEVKPESGALGKFFPEGTANITTRNYPLSVADLRKKTMLKDGGEKFLIGFTSIRKKNLVVASRIA